MTVVTGIARRFQAPLFASVSWGVTWALAFLLFTIMNFFWLSGSISTRTLPKITPGVLILCLANGMLGALIGLACSLLLPPDFEELESLSMARVALFGALAGLAVRVVLGKLVMWGLLSGLNTAVMMDLAIHLPSFAWASIFFFTSVGAVCSSGALHLARSTGADRLLGGEIESDHGSSIRETGDTVKGMLPR